MKNISTLKEKSKKICRVATYVITATLITSPLAFAAPTTSLGTENLKFKTTSNYVSACSSNYVCIFAQSYDDNVTGYMTGSMTISDYSSGYGSYISCYGAEYGDAVSVNKGNGNASVKGTIDSSSPSCYASNWNPGPLTVNVSGTYNGSYSISGSGKYTSNFPGGKFTYDSNFNYFNETFTGSIPGFTGTLKGSANASRYTNRQQVN